MARIDQAKNTLRTARLIRNLNSTPQVVSDTVGKADQDDLFRVQIGNRSTLNLELRRGAKQSKISIQVLSLKGAVNKALKAIGNTAFSDLSRKQTQRYVNVLASRSVSSQAKTINLALDSGSFYIRVFRNQGNNSYRLTSTATPIPAVTPNPIPVPNPGPTPNPNPVPNPNPSPSPNPNPSPNPTPNPTPNPSPTPNPLTFPAQTWLRQFGSSDNDYAYGTAVDDAGSLYVAGVKSTSNAFLGSGFVAKYKSDGSQEWQRPLAIQGSTAISDVAVDGAGNYYVAGAIVEGFNSDGFLAKYNSAGTQEWIREIESTSIGVDAVSGIVIDSTTNSNDVYVTGIRRGAPALLGASQGKAFVAKYTSGGILFNVLGCCGFVVFGNARTTAASGIAIGNGSLYLTGITDANLNTNGSNVELADGDVFVAGFNQSTGALLWNDTLQSGSGTDYGRGIAVNGSELYIVGQTAGALPSGSLPANTFGGGSSDAFVAKYTVTNSSGTRQWVKQVGGSGLDAAQAITIDPSGKIYLTGETDTGLFGTAAGGSDAWIAQADSNGDLIRTTQLGTPQDDEAYSLITDSTGALYVAGQTQGTFANSPTQNLGKYDVWLGKYSPS